MDDQRTDREGSSLKRLLLALSIIPVSLVGIYLTVIASLGIGMAVRDYDPQMAMFSTAFSAGIIFGIWGTIAASQYMRRLNVRLPRFKIRDLFVVMTTAAIILGLMSYMLNKK